MAAENMDRNERLLERVLQDRSGRAIATLRCAHEDPRRSPSRHERATYLSEVAATSADPVTWTLVTEPTGPLVGKVALVSGAARGVGLACARCIAELGAYVVLTDVDVAAGAESARRLCADGLRASFAPLDVSNLAAIRACVADVVSSHGRIDVLVNNAGIALVAEIEDVTEQLWDRTFQVNLKGTFFLSQAVMPYMKAQRSGRIINVASVAARSGGLMPLAPYAASKAGIVNLTKSFAGRLAAYGINVNAVAPGPVDTDLTRSWTDEQRERTRQAIPWGRFASADEVGQVVAFLAGPSATYMTGTTVDVNGGLRMD